MATMIERMDALEKKVGKLDGLIRGYMSAEVDASEPLVYISSGTPVGEVSKVDAFKQSKEDLQDEGDLQAARHHFNAETAMDFICWVEEKREPIRIWPPGYVTDGTWMVTFEQNGVPHRLVIKGESKDLYTALYEVMWKDGWLKGERDVP